FSPDSKRLASASGAKVQVRDATTGQETLSLEGHNGPVSSVRFSPDGKRLASASGEEVKFGAEGSDEEKVRDAKTAKETDSVKGHTDLVTSVCFSGDGQHLASASGDWTVKVWDATTAQPTLTLKGHTGAVTSVCFSPDGQRLASASGDRTVKVWDATTAQET